MNPKSLVEPIDAVGGSHLHVGGNPNLLLTPSIQKARKQGSVVAWSHFSNLPGLESIIAIPLGLIDTVELLNWEDPIQLPSHQTVWDYSLIPMVDFPILRGMDLYFQYLNAGFQIPITAGTDKLRSNIPLGSNRHYVRINGIADFESCLEGIKRGTGFVTNGPMLSLEVDNSVPGDTSDFEDVRRVKVLVKAESILPFARLELIANGNIVYSKPLENYRKKRELYTLELETEVSIDESTWFAARVTSLDTPKLLPRNLSVFAHSNPIYFLKNQEPVRIESSINYLIDYAEQVENWIQNHAEFRNDEEKELALEYLQKAEQILREKLYLRNGNR